MADGAGNEIVLVGVTALHEELGHAVAHRRALDVLAQRPPAVVVHLAHLLVGAVEERDVFFHPLRGLSVGNGGDDILVLHCIEVFSVVGKVVVS